uniref:Multidrug resistance efflux pump n=1 Tax=uncultured bacterium CSLG7 TaxID=1091577 RepID=G4WV48_9BACT|nr:multidrug resistance efflux pump [uncultured bacterium CSLG7]
MANDQSTYASEQEIEQLREEIRHLREEQEKGHQDDKNQEAKDSDNKSDDNAKNDEHKPEEPKKPHPLRKILLIILALVLVAAGIAYWMYSRQFEDTDDAEVDGHINSITARISGTITGVYVEENQFVKAGQILADLDPRDNAVALAVAQSQLAEAQAQNQAERPNVPVTETSTQTSIASAAADVTSARAAVAAADQNYQAALAKVSESEANSSKAQADVERYRPLAAKDEVPREQFDQVVANAKALAATVAANQATAQAAAREADQTRAQLAQAQERAEEAKQNAPRQVEMQKANVTARQAAIRTARAQLDQARLNLSYVKIQSPVNGIVAKRTAEVGQHVEPGQQLVLITQIDDLWVTANFKETQLLRMKPGQGVRIRVDALSSDFDGYIESLPAASGAITSLLPPENATGNFVKVVQRLPVRIRFKPNQNGLDRLRPGMSAEPKVRVE